MKRIQDTLPSEAEVDELAQLRKERDELRKALVDVQRIPGLLKDRSDAYDKGGVDSEWKRIDMEICEIKRRAKSILENGGGKA